MHPRDAPLLILLAALWGAVYPLTTVALRDFPTAHVVVGRTILAAAVLVPAAVAARALSSWRRHPFRIALAALLQATFPLLLLTAGQQHVSASVAGILSAVQPVFVAVLVVVADRVLRLRQFGGILLGLAGTSLLFVRDLDAGGTTAWGGVAVLGSALGFAAGAVYIQRALPDTPPVGIAAAAMTVTTVVLAPVTARPTSVELDFDGVAAMIALGALCTGGALALFYDLIQRSGAVTASLVFYLAPAFAVVYDSLFLRNQPTASVLAGLVLIVAGSMVTAWRSTNR